MGEDLGKLDRSDTLLERQVEVVWHLRRLIPRDQSRHGDQATVAR